MPHRQSAKFSIGGSTTIDQPSTDSRGKRSRLKAETKIEDDIDDEVNFGDDKEPLEIRYYLLLDSLLPNDEGWKKLCNNQKKNRIRFLSIVAMTYLILWLSHTPIALMKTHAIAKHVALKTRLTERSGMGQPLQAVCIRTNCATLCPDSSIVRDWYTMYTVPYATLPQQKAYFALATFAYSFKECYLSYWHGVANDKRSFVNGQLTFMGNQAFDDDSECAQMRLKDGVLQPVGKPQSCLTLSFHFPWRKPSIATKTNFRGLPVVVYIGGSSLLMHRPRLISAKLASDLRIIYVAISYRLGVFGFSDFGIEGFGPNHGVADVREGLIWIQENIHLFGGDPTRVLLYGEDSGATIAASLLATSATETLTVNKEVRALFTHVWLADGSMVIPHVSNAKDAFREMVLNDPDLEEICQEWISRRATKSLERSQPLAAKFHCLSDVSVAMWTNKTPLAWNYTMKADSSLFPHSDEVRTSLIKRDPFKSQVENPLGMFLPSEGYSPSRMRDIPLVVYSNLNKPYNYTGSRNVSERWALDETEKFVKEALNTFHKPASQLPYAEAIWNAYQEYLNILISWRQEDLAPDKIDYRILYDVIRGDLREICPYNLYAKHVQLSGHIQAGPIYRILNRIRSQPYVDGNGARCDVPFFLIDDWFDCGEGTQPLYEYLQPDQKEVLIRAFVQFAYYGNILGAREMQYPISPGMMALETTYNIITDTGLTTAGVREMSLLSACRIWISEEGEFDHVMKYARMN